MSSKEFVQYQAYEEIHNKKYIYEIIVFLELFHNQKFSLMVHLDTSQQEVLHVLPVCSLPVLSLSLLLCLLLDVVFCKDFNFLLFGHEYVYN